MFDLLRNSQLFSKMAAPFYVSIENVRGSDIFPSSPLLVSILCFSVLAVPVCAFELASHRGFDLHFLDH